MKLKHKIAALTALPVFLQASLTMSCTAAKIDSTEASVLSEETTAFYENWKDKYLVQDTYVSDETQYYVWYSEEKNTAETTFLSLLLYPKLTATEC